MRIRQFFKKLFLTDASGFSSGNVSPNPRITKKVVACDHKFADGKCTLCDAKEMCDDKTMSDGDKTKPYGDVTYAKPGKNGEKDKYPIDTAEHIRAAWNYANKYNESADVKSRIVAAWKNKIDKAGPPSAKKNADDSAGDVTLPDIPILTTGPTKNGYEITDEIFQQVLATFNPEEFSPVPVVDVPHEVEEGPALAYVSGLYTKDVVYSSGEIKPWIYAKLEASSPENGDILAGHLAGPMKFNSPELVPASHLPDYEIYTPEKTAGWPDELADSYVLRRVNVLGSQPAAQFGQQAALLADKSRNGKQYLCLGSLSPKEITTMKRKCGSCGVVITLADPAHNFCPHCGNDLPAAPVTGLSDSATPAAGKEPDGDEGKEKPPVKASDDVEMAETLDEKTPPFVKKMAEKQKSLEEENRQMRRQLEFNKKEIAAERQARLEKDVELELSDYIEKGVLTLEKAQKYAPVFLALSTEKREVKLADGTSQSVLDIIREDLDSRTPVVTPGRMRVMNMSERQAAVADNDKIEREYIDKVGKDSPEMPQAEKLIKAYSLAEKDPRYVSAGRR